MHTSESKTPITPILHNTPVAPVLADKKADPSTIKPAHRDAPAFDKAKDYKVSGDKAAGAREPIANQQAATPAQGASKAADAGNIAESAKREPNKFDDKSVAKK